MVATTLLNCNWLQRLPFAKEIEPFLKVFGSNSIYKEFLGIIVW
jgi:hypothetical protein